MRQTKSAISENETRVLAGIQKAVSEAVETQYKVVIGQVGTKERESRVWPIMMTVLPVLLTVGLGWWVTRAQMQITKTIDDQKQELTTRLALTQEYQKRKLDVYQECTKNASNLTQALEALRMDPGDQKAASDAVHDLYSCTQNNVLYVTQDVVNALEKVQTDAIEIMQKAGRKPVSTEKVDEDVKAAEKLMLQELTKATIPLNPPL